MSWEVLQSCLEEIDYIFDRLAQDYASGIHPSSVTGAGFNIKGYADIFDYLDFSQIDWLVTAVSCSETPLVRILDHESSITVFGLVDVTASIGFAGVGDKMKEIAKAVASLGFSAYKVGDRFGVVAYGDKIEAYFEPRITRTYALEIGEWIWNFKPKARSTAGLLETINYLTERPMLIFWFSDFHQPDSEIEEFLKRLDGKHDLVPLICWDSAEFAKIPRWGIGWLRDPETGEERMEFFTPRRACVFREKFNERMHRLNELFRKYQVDTLTLLDKFNVNKFTEFFIKRRN